MFVYKITVNGATNKKLPVGATNEVAPLLLLAEEEVYVLNVLNSFSKDLQH